MERKIYQTLKDLGVRMSLEGFDLLISLMKKYIHGKQNKKRKGLMDYYELVAEEYGITRSATERCIRTAIASAGKREQLSPLYVKLFGDDTKVKNGDFFATVYKYMYYEMLSEKDLKTA